GRRRRIHRRVLRGQRLRAQERGEQVTEPFSVKVSDDVLDDLRQRLSRTRFPDQLDESGWDYGTELGYLKELVAYWRDSYDWRRHEADLNRFDHFLTPVDGRRVHFIHARSPHP